MQWEIGHGSNSDGDIDRTFDEDMVRTASGDMVRPKRQIYLVEDMVRPGIFQCISQPG